jgi:site-specific DNA recombinase
MRFIGYVRVSVVGKRSGESFISPGEQRRRIEQWADLHGHEIVEVFEDLDRSGGTMDRPGFVTAMAMLEGKQADGICVAKLDRFARTLIGALDALKAIDGYGAEFASVADNFDTSTSTGRMVLNMMLVLAEFERDRITEGWDSTVQNAVQRGVWPNPVPFGYAKDADKRLIPSRDAQYVEEMFTRRAAGDTWASISEWLDGQGVKPGRGGVWRGEGVKTVIEGEVYLGVVEKMGYRNENAHPPLVTKSLWLAAQNVHGLERHPNSDGDGQLLSGVLRCAGCGYTMKASSYGRKGEQRRQYRCQANHGSGRCPEPVTLSAQTIEPYVTEQFFARVDGLSVEAHGGSTPGLVAAEAEFAEADADLRIYRDDADTQRALGQTLWLDGLTVRVSKRESALNALEAARRNVRGIELPDSATLRESWDSLSVRERRRLLGSAFNFVAVRKGNRGDMPRRTHVFWRGEGPTDLSRKGRSVPLRRIDW